MRPDRIAPALRELAPERRALLELSFRRGIPDEEIAAVLRVTPAEVERRREEGLERLGEILQLARGGERSQIAARLRALPDEAWNGFSSARAETDFEAPAAAGEPALPAAEQGEGRRTLRLAVLVGVVSAALAAVALAIIPAAEEDPPSQRPGSAREPAPAGAGRAAERARVPLEPLAGGSGKGVVQLIGDGQDRRVLVSARGLAPPGKGSYVVWLYQAVDDAVPLGAFDEGSFRLSAQLPRNAARYPAIDISLEPRDGNESHAGDSVLRAPLRAAR